MESTLNQIELDAIAKKVSEIIIAKTISLEGQKNLQEQCEKYTKQVINFWLSDNVIAAEAQPTIQPVLMQYLEKNNIVEKHMSAYMNTEEFKKLELKHLKQRVASIEYELYQDEKDS